MKWSGLELAQTKTAGLIVNRPVRRQSLSNTMVSLFHRFCNTPIYFWPQAGRRKHVLTVAEWQRREQLTIGLQLLKAFVGAMFIFFMIYVFLVALILITPEVG